MTGDNPLACHYCVETRSYFIL